MNTQVIEMNINKVVVDSIAKMMKDTLSQCADNIIANFQMLKDCDEDERKDKILAIFGLDADTVCKIKAPVKKTTEKKAKVAKLPIPFLPRLVDTNKCHGLTTALFTQCGGKKVEGSDYCSKCCKNLVANGKVKVPKNGTVEMRTIQYQNTPFAFMPPPIDGEIKTKKIYYIAHVERFVKKHPELDGSKQLKAHLKTLGCTDEEIATLLTPPPPKGKGKGKGGKKEKKEKEPTPDAEEEGEEAEEEESEEDIDDDSSVATDATEATEATNATDANDDDLEFPDDDDDELIVEQPEKKVTFQRPKEDFRTGLIKIKGQSTRIAYIAKELEQTGMTIGDAISKERITVYRATGTKTDWEVVWPLEVIDEVNSK